MPRPVKSSRTWNAGYEKGSAFDRLSPSEKKRIKKLMQLAGRDQRAFESSARQAGWSVGQVSKSSEV